MLRSPYKSAHSHTHYIVKAFTPYLETLWRCRTGKWRSLPFQRRRHSFNPEYESESESSPAGFANRSPIASGTGHCAETVSALADYIDSSNINHYILRWRSPVIAFACGGRIIAEEKHNFGQPNTDYRVTDREI